MKINFLSPGFYRSGGLLTVYDYSQRFVQNGHQVTLYIPKRIYNFQVDKIQPIEILRRIVRRFKVDRNKYLSELNKYNFNVKIVPVLKEKYIDDADVTIATAWPTAYDLNRLDKCKGEKVYFIQDYEVWDSNIKYVDLSYKLPLKRIVISKYLQDLLIEKFNVQSEIVKTSINFNIYNNSEKVFNKNTVILFIYSLADRKNVNIILKSLEYVKKQYPSIIIKSFGFEEFLNLPDYIQYYQNPDIEERLRLYRTSDIFLLSSNFEGFGIPPAEAMACKCAVISTDVGAIREYSENGISSLIVPTNNVSEFIKAIEYLITNPSELQKLSFNGYESVRKSLNYDKSVAKFERLLIEWSRSSK